MSSYCSVLCIQSKADCVLLRVKIMEIPKVLKNHFLKEIISLSHKLLVNYVATFIDLGHRGGGAMGEL